MLWLVQIRKYFSFALLESRFRQARTSSYNATNVHEQFHNLAKEATLLVMIKPLTIYFSSSKKIWNSTKLSEGVVTVLRLLLCFHYEFD